MRTFLCSLRTDPAPLGRMGRSAGSVLRALRKLEGEGAFALCARGFAVRLQGSLRTDPAPLRFFGAPRHRSDARREAQGRMYVRSAPPGHRKPARGETPGMAHNRSVLKERRMCEHETETTNR